MNQIPFYKRFRFLLLFGVMLVVTVSGAMSSLLSYRATTSQFGTSLGHEFYNGQQTTKTFFTFLQRQIVLISQTIAADRPLQQALAPHGNHFVADRLHMLRQANGLEILLVIDEAGKIIAGNEDEKIISSDSLPFLQLIKDTLKGGSAVTVVPENIGFVFYGMVPFALPDSDENYFILSGYLLHSSFLKQIPLHEHVRISLVHRDQVTATTVPGDSLGQVPQIIDSRQFDLSSSPADQKQAVLFLGEKRLLCFSPLPGMEKITTDYVVFSHSHKKMFAAKMALGRHFVLIFFLGLASTSILLLLFSKSILKPIRKLKELVSQINEGDLSKRIKSDSINEFTPLIEQFNSMLDQLQKKDATLSHEVVDRTDELQKQNIFIDNLLRSSTIMAIAATDLDFKVTYFNPRAEELFGHSAEQVLGKRVSQFHPLVNGKTKDMGRVLEKVKHSGTHTFTMELKKDASVCIIEATLSAIRDQNEVMTGLMLMARDISDARKQEAHLQSVLAEIKTILDNTFAGVILVQDDHIVRVNSTVEKMLGYTGKEIRELNWTAFRALIFAGKETRHPVAEEPLFSLQKKNRQLFWAKVRRISLTSDVECGSVLYLFEDVSRQKEMFERIQQLGQAVDQSSNSIVITSISGEIEYVNKAFVKTTGYSAKEAIGLTPAVLNSGQTPASTFQEMWETITSGREWTGEFVNKKKNGELYDEHVVIAPLRNEEGKITHFVATKDNITDLKKARFQAESASHAKSDFLANMSHEIRTPMNAIIGMSELLLDTALDPEQQRYLTSVNNSAAHLLTLINDILDYSKIEANQLLLETIPFNPHMLIEDIVTTLSLQARQKELQLNSLVAGDGERDILLLGDPFRLKQVLLNITGNALKFTDKGTVSLELTLCMPAMDSSALYSVGFTVRDTGIGIPREQQETIFDDFSQTDGSITRKFGGTGLGLAISRRLVQFMGGAIEVESSPGKGSTFSFTLFLPRALKQRQVITGPQVEQPPLAVARNLTVLLVEDNPANQELATILLKNQGHDVRVANNGLEALQCLSKEEYDLVFMDIQMPVMDGLTTTRYIRKFEQGIIEGMPECAAIAEHLALRLGGRHLHIIAVTANAMESDRQCCLDSGMDNYLSKPYKKRSFQEVLENSVGTTLQDHSGGQNDSSLPGKEETVKVSVETVRDHLMENYGLESGEADTILETYAESLRENLQKLQKAVETRDGEEAANRAHALKGAFLNIGQMELADTAHLLEKELSQKIEASHVTLVEQLIEILQSITDTEIAAQTDMKS